jgi:molecular chaperone DnaK
MAESILKLRVDSSEYDSKIDRARQGLLHLGDSLNKAGKSFKDADADQVKFAADLGNMPTKTNTARGAVAELTKAYTDLRIQYDKLSDADKQPVNDAIAKLKDSIAKDDTDAMKSDTEGLTQAIYKLSEKLYQAAGGAAGAAGGPQGQPGPQDYAGYGDAGASEGPKDAGGDF